MNDLTRWSALLESLVVSKLQTPNSTLLFSIFPVASNRHFGVNPVYNRTATSKNVLHDIEFRHDSSCAGVEGLLY